MHKIKYECTQMVNFCLLVMQCNEMVQLQLSNNVNLKKTDPPLSGAIKKLVTVLSRVAYI